jgi:membrane-bound lytic murein transglycosylase F
MRSDWPRDRGMNPHQCRHLKALLPLLAMPEIAARMPYGSACGTEAVRYLRRIREYRPILRRHRD